MSESFECISEKVFLTEEQQFAILGQDPFLVVDEQFELGRHG
jgi:hypothetical protein